MIINKAYRFRLYPDFAQAKLIDKTIGCARFVFNFFLNKQKEKEKYWYLVDEMVQNGQLASNEWKGDFFNKNETIKALPELKAHYPFLKEVDSIALQKSIENLNDAYQRYYNKQNKEPCFKSKMGKNQSYTTKKTKGNIAVYDHHIKLPKLGLVKIAKSREVTGRVINATIRRKASGKYFVSILVQTEVEMPKIVKRFVCTYVGIKEFVALSNDGFFGALNNIHKLHEKLERERHHLSRKKTGSANWKKQQKKVARVFEKITNVKKDYLDKLSMAIVSNCDMLVIEADGQDADRDANADIEVSWHQFKTMLEYKAKWNGKTVIVLSKTESAGGGCSVCRYQGNGLCDFYVEYDRTCPSCHIQHRNVLALMRTVQNDIELESA